MSDCIITRRGGSTNLTTKTITANGTYTPTSDYDGFSQVTVDVPSSSVRSVTEYTVVPNSYIGSSGGAVKHDSDQDVYGFDLGGVGLPYIAKFTATTSGFTKQLVSESQYDPTEMQTQSDGISKYAVDSTLAVGSSFQYIAISTYRYLYLCPNHSSHNYQFDFDIKVLDGLTL